MKELTRRDFIVTSTTAAAGACLCVLPGCLLLSLEGDTPRIQPEAYEIRGTDKITEIFISTVKTPELLNEGKAYKIIDPRLNDSLIIAIPETVTSPPYQSSAPTTASRSSICMNKNVSGASASITPSSPWTGR